MFLTMLRIFSVVLVLSLFGCVTPEESPHESSPVKQKVFNANYDKVWRAIQKALANYPVRINNIDIGTYETDEVKGTDVWSSPFDKKSSSSGLKYYILLTAQKGKIGQKDSTRITIEKKITLQKDFFSDPVSLMSDGFEEEEILYRIGREIVMDKN